MNAETTETYPIPQLWVERVSIALLVAFGIVVTGMGHAAFALTAVGAGLIAVANFYLLRQLVTGLLSGAKPGVQIFLGMLLVMKFAILGIFAYFALQMIKLNPIAILTGLSLVVLGIFAETVRSSLLPRSSE